LNIDKLLKKALGKDISRDMTLYHGTNTANFERIKREGLKPYKSMWGYRPSVFLTANRLAAKRYAVRSAKRGTQPLVLKVDVPDTMFHPKEVHRAIVNPYVQLVTHYAIPPRNIQVDESKNKRRCNKMPVHRERIGTRHVKRVRMVDVGRPKHHYLEVDVLTGKGKRGGKTVGHIVSLLELQKRAKHMRKHKRK
jgi:hypothetical protein